MTTRRTTTSSLEERIAQHITRDGSVVVPQRVARWLDKQSGMNADRRIALRGTDPEFYVVLAALHLVALGADCGTNSTAGQQNTAGSEMWLSTKQAAKALNVTDRCVRKWIATGRLHAEMVGARWLINPHNITLALREIA
ncbi:helix-turn-helix domain-containing protein [Mycobacterium sp. Root265]|uniref:helix-turn-helix domain-containing protein n=1 Tax=Mycobacterium sp. Root265 TaxID=1736504 RepID=UPI0009E68972|nr:helix-turn-helix domain-containing protein [Mycobacterium sp. Root265]